MPEVKNCCCCISLRTGTITFGVLGLIGSLILSIYATFCVIVINNAKIDDGLVQFSAFVMLILSAIAMVISVTSTLFHILVTCGAIKRNTCILMTWIVLLWIGIILACIGSVTIPFESSFKTKGKVIGVVMCVVQAALTAYQLLVVHSYRKQIIREDYEPLLSQS